MPAVQLATAAVWTTTAGNKASGAFTPPTGALLVAFVGRSGTDTAPTMSDSLSGAWTLADVFRSQATAGGLRAYVRNTPVPAESMTVTMTGSGDTGGGLAVLTVESVGAYGSAAVRTTGGQADQGAGGTPAPVLGLTPLASSAILIGLMDNTNGSANQTPRTGYTERVDQGYNTPASGLAVQSLNDGETSATLTFGGTTPSIFATIALEIITSPEPPSRKQARYA